MTGEERLPAGPGQFSLQRQHLARRGGEDVGHLVHGGPVAREVIARAAENVLAVASAARGVGSEGALRLLLEPGLPPIHTYTPGRPPERNPRDPSPELGGLGEPGRGGYEMKGMMMLMNRRIRARKSSRSDPRARSPVRAVTLRPGGVPSPASLHRSQRPRAPRRPALTPPAAGRPVRARPAAGGCAAPAPRLAHPSREERGPGVKAPPFRPGTHPAPAPDRVRPASPKATRGPRAPGLRLLLPAQLRDRRGPPTRP